MGDRVRARVLGDSASSTLIRHPPERCRERDAAKRWGPSGLCAAVKASA